ncbi:MAG: copper amine oxidase N-terminal domain-containing protein [Firmicutes bacterium]|nr:copper amine oxidase N-terminal domain-containing protein [Bacillota bacterium]
MLKKFFVASVLAGLFVSNFSPLSTVSVNATDNLQLPQGQTTFVTGEYLVNGQEIAAASPSVWDGVIMLPVRAIAEGLNFSVVWDSAEQRIEVNENYFLWIGQDRISRDGGQTIDQFGPAPQIIDGVAYVPLPFFNFGLSGVNAEIVDGVVVVNFVED